VNKLTYILDKIALIREILDEADIGAGEAGEAVYELLFDIEQSVEEERDNGEFEDFLPLEEKE